jgi:hypothetical protein
VVKQERVGMGEARLSALRKGDPRAKRAGKRPPKGGRLGLRPGRQEHQAF